MPQPRLQRPKEENAMSFGIWEASVPVFMNSLTNMRDWLSKPTTKKRNRTPALAERDAMVRLTDALAQPLTAASNYVGVARLLLQTARANASGLPAENLKHAKVQIVRAGRSGGSFASAWTNA
jgi:hypothetical protein